MLEAGDRLDEAETDAGFPVEDNEVGAGVEVKGDVVEADGGSVVEGVAVRLPVVVDGGGVKPP